MKRTLQLKSQPMLTRSIRFSKTLLDEAKKLNIDISAAAREGVEHQVAQLRKTGVKK